MARSIHRLYFDYNATAPQASSSKDWPLLFQGDVFANPSSIHREGKLAKKWIYETEDFLRETFLIPSSRPLVFHSGATEGINTIIKGLLFEFTLKKKDFVFYSSPTDHSCASEQKEWIERVGGSFKTLPIRPCGSLDLEKALSEIRELSKSISGAILINFTRSNNETGVVWPLSDAAKLKAIPQTIIHVDDVQAPGKIKDWDKLDHKLDYYTYSGHKFGALKGIGLSIYPSTGPRPFPLLTGGGHQNGLRSGTMNFTGIKSLQLALSFLKDHYDYEEQLSSCRYVETKLLERFPEQVLINGLKAQHRNANTLSLTLNGVKSDILATAFDMAQMAVSQGSACSSGTSRPSKALMAMGRSEEEAKSTVRVSFSPYFNQSEAELAFKKIEEVLGRFLKS